MAACAAGDEVGREGGAVDAHALVEHHLLGLLVVGDDVVDVEVVTVHTIAFALHLVGSIDLGSTHEHTLCVGSRLHTSTVDVEACL